MSRTILQTSAAVQFEREMKQKQVRRQYDNSNNNNNNNNNNGSLMSNWSIFVFYWNNPQEYTDQHRT
jgi:hypothetical protein